jgi:putative endonuclease
VTDRRRATRPDTRRIGREGEEVAARYLARRGFTIVARNLRSQLGELDLVAEDGATLVFVEVKARRGPADVGPQAAVDGRKRARLVRLALGYLGRPGVRRERQCRFDVVAVSWPPSGGPPRVEHFEGAFVCEGWAP